MKRTGFHFLLPASLLFLITILSSCTVTQHFSFSKNGAAVCGDNSTDIKAGSFFTGVMEDLSSWQNRHTDKSAVEDAVDNYVATVNESQHTNYVYYSTVNGDTYRVSFSFTDLESVIREISKTDSQTIFTVSENNGRTHIEFLLDINNYGTLKKIVPFLEEENFAVYGPEYNNDISQEDYLEMIGFVLGDEAPQRILESSISVEITLPSWCIASNGEKSGKNSVIYTVPLIDVLLLHKPIRLWCEF